MQKSIIIAFTLIISVTSWYNLTKTIEHNNPRSDFDYIGTKQFILEDSSRVDNYYGGIRKINAQVWYPSDGINSESIQTPYLLYFRKLYKNLDGWSDEDYEIARNIKTGSFIDAPIAKNLNKAPLLIFSPSLGVNLSYYTYYAEFFAKKGYIVMGINHLYESEAIIGKDSSIYTANLSFHDSLKTLKIPDEITPEKYREVKGVRQKVLAEDIVFGLNRILTDSILSRRIDEKKIGVFGHSIGGSAAVYSSIIDKRIKAVINMDGTPPTIALNNGIDVPFLFIEDLTDYRNHQGYAIMHKRRSDFCELNRASSWRILINGFNHNSFLDVNYYFADNSSTAQIQRNKLDLVLNHMNTFLNFYLLGSSKFVLNPVKSDKVEVIYFEK